jgi:hypothetical protein
VKTFFIEFPSESHTENAPGGQTKATIRPKASFEWASRIGPNESKEKNLSDICLTSL